MMIPSAGASPYAAVAALDQPPRSGGDAPDDAGAGTPLDAAPDVIVTLGGGTSLPSTYNASGRLAGAPTLDELGANAPDSLAHATESRTDAPGGGDDDGVPSPAANATAGATAGAAADAVAHSAADAGPDGAGTAEAGTAAA
jgi:hypothetical protein